MKPMLLVAAALPFLASGCAATLPPDVTASGEPAAEAEARPFRYSSPISGYTHRAPVDPKPWRDQNDAQAPEGDAS